MTTPPGQPPIDPHTGGVYPPPRAYPGGAFPPPRGYPATDPNARTYYAQMVADQRLPDAHPDNPPTSQPSAAN